MFEPPIRFLQKDAEEAEGGGAVRLEVGGQRAEGRGRSFEGLDSASSASSCRKRIELRSPLLLKADWNYLGSSDRVCRRRF